MSYIQMHSSPCWCWMLAVFSGGIDERKFCNHLIVFCWDLQTVRVHLMFLFWDFRKTSLRWETGRMGSHRVLEKKSASLLAVLLAAGLQWKQMMVDSLSWMLQLCVCMCWWGKSCRRAAGPLVSRMNWFQFGPQRSEVGLPRLVDYSQLYRLSKSSATNLVVDDIVVFFGFFFFLSLNLLSVLDTRTQ